MRASGSRGRLALEVNGETYHAEGIIPNSVFDDNLFRQNEIIRAGLMAQREMGHPFVVEFKRLAYEAVKRKS